MTYSPSNHHRLAFGGNSPGAITKSHLGMASPSRYEPDGIGRDTYIGNNNGGLYARHRPASAMSIGTFYTRKRQENNLCDIGAKRSNYAYNGSGRDSYIG